MKKLFGNLMLAALAVSSLTVVSCSDDDGDGGRKILDYEKKHDTAVLLVTFGSTYVGPHQTYADEQAQFAQAFPDADIFFSFTSTTCINRWLAAQGEQFATPDQYMQSFIENNYKHVYVQSLHTIPGQEFQILRDHYVKTCYNFAVQDMTPAREPACCGEALLKSDADIREVARILVDQFAAQLRNGDAVAFMGHGNPISDYDHANNSYAKIEQEMRSYARQAYGNDNLFVGTVDFPAMLIDYVLGQMEGKVAKTTPVHLHPLMTIAGDHANNDMADEEDPESWISLIKAAGWSNVTCTQKGLGDYPAIVNVWIRHLREAIETIGEE